MIKRLVAMVMLLLLGMALPRPAVAGDAWFTYPCASGTMHVESVTYEVAAPNAIRVELPGSLPCSAEGKYRFAVATFTPGATTAQIYPGMLGAYNPVGATEFVAAVGIRKQEQLGLCLMPDSQTRLSCALISIDSNGVVSVSSLDAGDTAVIGELSGLTPQPECNTCWSVR